ncbi:MAG: AbrB/MazE/SpoVT family DNA-binding domain-containing protein [Verrucomicrobia bacterium]|nr:AbrB/MazE/SpoVT family DNA-binding domain-containing protein [Verrucomicrobiota bacterium]MDA1066296.1 AbrB/MazE/SpoVT family DNA-binding domain-containing protein [Verrucomicrobiota bacterium]
MKTIVSSKGQVVLPIEIRERDHIVAGQKFDIERLDAGEYLLKRREYGNNEGLVDWLLDCPENNWFEPIESESTDTF